MEHMTYGSVYEITNPLTKVAGQRFIDGLKMGRWIAKIPRWTLTYQTGSGTVIGSMNGNDGGYGVQTSGGGTDQTNLTFNNTRFLSNTGSVVIWTGMKSEGSWGGFGMSYPKDDGFESDSIILEAGTSNYIQFVTADNNQSGATTNTDVPYNMMDNSHGNLDTYKCEQMSASGNGYINGYLKATRTDKLSRKAMQPVAYSYGASQRTVVRWCEAYNT